MQELPVLPQTRCSPRAFGKLAILACVERTGDAHIKNGEKSSVLCLRSSSITYLDSSANTLLPLLTGWDRRKEATR